MKKNFFFININEKILILFLFVFALLINQYYGNKGVFPVDSFAHFDTGFRILLGEYPFKNYWIVSGPFVDYLQAIFFYFFGVNWQAYVLHASLINGIITVSTFLVLRNFNLGTLYCFIYSLSFSILAYPSSGTPFVDHHSAFFSLLGIYFLILAIKNEKVYYWILLPIFLGFAFLSKQVPASYTIISTILVLFLYMVIKKKYIWFQYTFLSASLFIIFLLILGKIHEISLSSFLEQYIFYPQTIGEKRFDNFDITFRGVIGHFKFIYLAFIPLVYFNFKKILSENNYFKQNDFFYFLILILFTFSLIFHQLLTRNQTFIFFLIPIIIAFSHININKNKKLISLIFVLFCLFITTKYHLRFNENRKFHELNYSNFDLSSSAKEIDNKFVGLKWITPKYSNNPNQEIKLIKETLNYLKNDRRKKMVMTNYSFFSVLLEEKIFSIARWHIFDGTDYPQKKSKYFMNYRNLFINSIRKNDIDVIYTIDLNQSRIYNYIDKSCFEKNKLTKILTSYELKNCVEING